MTKETLDIGVLLDDVKVADWLYASLERVKCSPAVNRVVLLIDETRTPASPVTTAYRLFDAMDTRLSRKLMARDALARRDVRALFPETQCIYFNSQTEGAGRRMADSDKALITELHLHVLVQGEATRELENLPSSRFGLWFYRFGDRRRVQGSPVGFHEYLHKMPTTGASLEMRSGARGDIARVLEQMVTTTYFFSPRVNRNLLYQSAAGMLARQLEKLHRLGAQRYFAEIEKREPPFGFHAYPEYRVPGWLGTLRAWGTYFSRVLVKALRDRLLWEKWHLLINLSPGNAAHPCRYREVVAPAGEYWADPFLWRHEGKDFVFMEIFCRQRQKGHLAVSELRNDGTLTAPVTILDAPYHLSYPCLVEHQGTLYMLPESKDNNAVSLYRCVEFPYRWEWLMHLMEDIAAVDTTPFFHDGKWWLFMTVVDVDGARARETLCLFYADDLLSREWTPHPLNPVVTDTRHARPAGHLLRQGERLFRPAQDCSNTYGHALVFREIKTLTVDDYEEAPCEALGPFWSPGLVGVHTFARQGDVTVIDACRRVFNSPRLQALADRWNRLTGQ